VIMDDPSMTMEEYIKLEEEKARRRGRVFNWQTATNGKIRVDDDLYDLRSMEAEFPAIVIDDTFTPQDALPCKSQVSTLVNDEIDFRISFGESDDEDYTIICDKNSFSYKMISFNNLKTDSENDNENADMAPLPPLEQRHPFLRYQGLEYTDADIVDFKDRMRMEHHDDAGGAKRRLSWRQFILALGLHTGEEMESPRFARFPRTSPFLHFDQRSSVQTLPSDDGTQYCWEDLISEEILEGLTVIAPELPIIDMGELVRLQICMEVDDTWAWVAIGPEKQPDAAAGSPAIAKDAPAADEGDQAIPAPELRGDVGSLRGLVKRSMTNQGRFSIWMMSCMAQLMDASGLTYQAFDGTFRGSSPAAFQRRTRQRNDEANTSAA
ncbi:hypothetical protein Tco_1248483, partial [Tanacetum coccineum]